MAKGIGLIGNFKGKVGNMVGYKLSDSNTGNSQGIRVYQPIVKNPKTSAQAEQRAKLAPINATYRALKMVIDRGNEGLPYGNKSRLAWLKGAFKAEYMPWFVKGANVNKLVPCQLTKGSLPGLVYVVDDGAIDITCAGVTGETQMATIGNVSTALKAAYPWLKDGDQITIVTAGTAGNGIATNVFSFLIDAKSTEAQSLISADSGKLSVNIVGGGDTGSIIVSREGANGEHLRSTSFLNVWNVDMEPVPFDADSKAAAIASYQNAASANADWAEESIQ
jgi:hypothetical protein